MPNQSVNEQSQFYPPIKLVGGVDYFTDSSALAPAVLSRSENLASQGGTLDRREGAVKIARLATPSAQGASHTFGTDAKYATFTPPLIPYGGWAAVWHFNFTTAITAAQTWYIQGAIPTGQTWNVLALTAVVKGTASATFTVTWRDSAGADHAVTFDVDRSDGDPQPVNMHVLALYDAVAGTFKVWLNGTVVGTPLTGLSATLRPAQDAGVVWTFGLKKVTGAAVTTNTAWKDPIDGFTLFTLRGKTPANGLTETLRRHSARAWPTPQMDFVLASYDMDESSGSVMYDRSNRGNNGTYVGSPAASTAVALLSAPCNLIDRIEVPDGKWNAVGSYGSLFTEAIGGLA